MLFHTNKNSQTANPGILTGFSSLAHRRKSVRKFTSQPVTEEQIKQLIKAASQAPSAGNCQPWHFYAVLNKNTVAQLYEKVYHVKWFAAASAVIIVCADPSASETTYGERGKQLYCIQDTAAATQNILLCAADMGIGSCWVGAFDEEACSALLRLPENHRPVVLIPLGTPKGNFSAPDRKPLNEILTVIE